MYYSTIHSYGWIVLFCAGIRVIFYTDLHNVDEDETTISSQNGEWRDDVFTGITRRNLCDSSSNVHSHVAYERRHWKLIKYYTDRHDVDEDETSISLLGGNWAESTTGIMCRGMNNLLFTLGPAVASSDMKNSHSYTDWHTVDEDLRTISNQGGWWIDNDLTGVEDRDLYHSHTSAFDTVASKKIIYLPPIQEGGIR